MLTYVTLFSSAGVGCYGLKQAGFECIATNELQPKRMSIQKANHKCKYPTGYIVGDARNQSVKDLIMAEIDMWKDKHDIGDVDVVFATPPCQGRSTANYKKNDHEQIRNSLVVEAIKMVQTIKPNVFVFENGRAFLKSICTDIDGSDMTIYQCINKHLGNDYIIHAEVINFMDYGVPSSRPRTLVIGVKNELGINPLQLFPTQQKQITLREAIGHLSPLMYGERDQKDPLHFARPYPKYMFEWIKDLKEGETAFDNPEETKPYSVDKSGNKVINKGAYMGNKYRRLFLDKPCACIATRSGCLSSQDTIHPVDNRVLSIRELMILMTIPSSFTWSFLDCMLTVDYAPEYLKKNECLIRKCIGEAVPTHIVHDIALHIKEALNK